MNLLDLVEGLKRVQASWGVTEIFAQSDLSQVSLLDQLSWLSRTMVLVAYSGTLSFSSFMFLRTGSVHLVISEYLGSRGLFFMHAEVYTDVDHLEFVWYEVGPAEVVSENMDTHRPPLMLDPDRFMTFMETAYQLHRGWHGRRVSPHVAPNQDVACQNRLLTEFDNPDLWRSCKNLTQSADNAAIDRLGINGHK